MKTFCFSSFYLPIFFLLKIATASAADVLYAVNCGGEQHFSEEENIFYEKDERFSGGIASNYGENHSPFPDVSDDYIYRTERYALDTFQYKLKIKQQGNQTIVLKFSEVYFKDHDKKVFSVRVGGHMVISNLDIYSKVGNGVPYHEYIEIFRKGQNLYVDGKLANSSPSAWDKENEEVTIEFVKLPNKDNPKINAIVLYEGNIKGVPKLPRRKAPSKSTKSDFHVGERKIERQESNLETVEILEEEDDGFDDVTPPTNFYFITVVLFVFLIFVLFLFYVIRSLVPKSNKVYTNDSEKIQKKSE